MPPTIADSLKGTIGERLFPLAQRIRDSQFAPATPDESRQFGLLLCEMWFVITALGDRYGGSVPAMECRSIVQEADAIINGDER